MSHQTGIVANQKLNQLISKSKSQNNIRLIKISIENEELNPSGTFDVDRDWQDDWCKYTRDLVEQRQPCYVLFRLDTLNGLNQHQWALISWIPDDSPVRQKMLYASTKATLKMTFGGGSITCDYLATTKDELSLKSFIAHKDDDSERTTKKMSELELDSDSNQHLLSEKEQNLLAVKRDEALAISAHTHSNKSTRSLPGLQFPLTDIAASALSELKSGTINYLQLSINTVTEEIDLTNKDQSFNVENLSVKIPEHLPRYHLFRFNHTHNERQYNSILFIYSVPSGQCPVKERMLYSSCKNALVTAIQDKSQYAIEIERKLEIDSPNELTHAYLINELHPPEDAGKPKFAKPKGPSGARGAKRLIKAND